MKYKFWNQKINAEKYVAGLSLFNRKAVNQTIC